jgi:sialic acid synthase SpsE
MDFFSRRYSFSQDDPVVLIGEAGVNHNGELALAYELVDAAVTAGVDIVKFQAFRTEKEISRFAELAPYQKEMVPDAKGQFEMCKALELPAQAFRDLKAYCASRDIGFLCSVFDFDSIDLLVDDIGAQALKIASGEVTNIPLLEYAGRKRVGVLLSTGASTLAEVGEAVAALDRAGCPELVLFHCVSNYPAPANELNLRAIQTLRNAFGRPVGFSDHSLGTQASIAAVALGAVVIEKHFTLDCEMEGPDHRASAEPEELARLAQDLRLSRQALGDGEKRPVACEMQNLPLIRRGLVANGALKKGWKLDRSMIEIKRPADGIAPRDLDRAVGRELARDLKDDEPITWDSLK